MFNKNKKNHISYLKPSWTPALCCNVFLYLFTLIIFLNRFLFQRSCHFLNLCLKYTRNSKNSSTPVWNIRRTCTLGKSVQTLFKLFHTCIYNPPIQMFSLANHAVWMPVYIPIFELLFFFFYFHSFVMKSLNLRHCLWLSPRVAVELQRGSSIGTKQFLCVFLINCMLGASGCYFKEFLPVTDLWSVYEFLELLMRLPDALSCLVWPTLNSQSADCWTE